MRLDRNPTFISIQPIYTPNLPDEPEITREYGSPDRDAQLEGVGKALKMDNDIQMEAALKTMKENLQKAPATTRIKTTMARVQKNKGQGRQEDQLMI